MFGTEISIDFVITGEQGRGAQHVGGGSYGVPRSQATIVLAPHTSTPVQRCRQPTSVRCSSAALASQHTTVQRGNVLHSYTTIYHHYQAQGASPRNIFASKTKTINSGVQLHKLKLWILQMLPEKQSCFCWGFVFFILSLQQCQKFDLLNLSLIHWSIQTFELCALPPFFPPPICFCFPRVAMSCSANKHLGKRKTQNASHGFRLSLTELQSVKSFTRTRIFKPETPRKVRKSQHF